MITDPFKCVRINSNPSSSLFKTLFARAHLCRKRTIKSGDRIAIKATAIETKKNIGLCSKLMLGFSRNAEGKCGGRQAR
jgi:hypothetical protein